MPDILTIDIENSPHEVLHFGKLWNTFLSPKAITRPTEVMSFAAKWYNKPKVHFYSSYHDGKEAMIQAAHNMLSNADIIITYNGKRHDVPHLNREFLEADLAPPAPYRHIDLDETMKRVFLFESHSLDYVSRRLGIGQKIENEGMPLWQACMAGDPKAWARFKRYNMQDVRLTENLYDTVKPWIRSHPNIAHDHKANEILCPTCAGDAWTREGFALTDQGKFQRYHCTTDGCGKWFRGTRRVNVGGTGVAGIAT